MKLRYDFASDTVSGACPEVMQALFAANEIPYAESYSEDAVSREAATLLAEVFERECSVYFLSSGTAANAFALSLLVDGSGGVICHPHAHLAVDEANAPEFFTGGAKLLTADGPNGKASPSAVTEVIAAQRGYHSAQPAVISISQTTEVGTVYTRAELNSLRDLAQAASLRIHVDGARLANALAATNCSAAEMTAGVDVLSLGGSKNGGLPCEAVVCFSPQLRSGQLASERIKRKLKRSGQLTAKSRLLACSWLGLLRNGTWLTNAKTANDRAQELAAGLAAQGFRLPVPVESNQVFVDLPEDCAVQLKNRGWKFYYFSSVHAYRFVCSWSTSREAVSELLADCSKVGGETCRT